MSPVFRALHTRLESLSLQRQKQTGVVKKPALALYDGRGFTRLVDEIGCFVDELERLVPAPEGAYRQLAEAEIADLNDEESLGALRNGADGTVAVLLDAAERKVNSSRMANLAFDLSVDEGDVQIGDQVSEEMLLRGIVLPNTTNSVRNITAKKGAIRIGHYFGVRSLALDRNSSYC